MMIPPEPKTSVRLRRAAEAERRQLERERVRIAKRRDALASELDELELQLLAIDERLKMLERLSGPSEAHTSISPPATMSGNRHAVLKGTAIRETATRVLADRPEGRGPIHYRRWFALLEEAGYAVAGKDPLAVFLTQISRSPVVVRSTEAGIYSLDQQAPERLRRRLGSLQVQLRDVAGAAPDKPADLARLRERREELHAEIKKLERAMDEAIRVLKPPPIAKAASG